MKKALPPLDIEKFKEPRFSHGEALAITGLTADTLLTWHKRGVVPNVGERDEEGRGHRRKYSTFDLAYLAVLKQLAGKMPLVMAGMTAANAAGAIITTYDMFALRRPTPILTSLLLGSASSRTKTTPARSGSR